MKGRIYFVLCAVSSLASFSLCCAILFKANGIHELASDGKQIFDTGTLIRQRALIGVLVSAFCFGCITLAQIPKRTRNSLNAISVAFILMSLVGLAICVGTYRSII